MAVVVSLAHADARVRTFEKVKAPSYQTLSAHSKEVPPSFPSAHLRLDSGVRFAAAVEPSVDLAAEFSKVAKKEVFEPKINGIKLDKLSLCNHSRSYISSKKFVENRSRPAGMLDVVFYDERVPTDAHAAELWPGQKEAYRTEGSPLSYLAKIYQVECLPTRIILGPRGVEYREGDRAWKPTREDKKDLDSDLGFKLQQVLKKER